MRIGIGVITLMLALTARAEGPAPAAVPAAAAMPAERPPSLGASLGAGFGVALVSLAVGGGLYAGGEGLDSKRAGMYTLTAGLAFGPLVSHLVAREWKRAAVFTALPLAATAGMVTLLQLSPEVLDDGSAATRFAFGILTTVAVLSSAVGLIDSFDAPARARARVRPALRAWSVAPALASGRFGIVLGGAF